MQPKIQRTLRKIYIFHALDDFILLYPLYNVFMADRGLSVFQISTLLILWSLTDIIANIPAGVLADKYSRKNLMGIGQLIKALGFVIWFVFPSYPGFALGFIAWGIAGALTGGTFEALVYDELRTADLQSRYVKVIGRARSLALIANATATALAGAAILLGYGLIYAGSVGVVLVSSLLVFTLPETKRFEEVVDKRYWSMLRQGVRETLHNRVILGIVVLGGLIAAVYGSLEEFVPLVVRDTGTSHSNIPLAVAATVIVAALGSLLAHRFENLRTPIFMGILIISGLTLLLGMNLAGLGVITPLIIYTFLIKLLGTVYEGKLQHSIKSGLRATITSAGEFVTEILAIITYLAYGLLGQHLGNAGAFKVIGATIAIVGLAYLIITPRLFSRRALAQAAE